MKIKKLIVTLVPMLALILVMATAFAVGHVPNPTGSVTLAWDSSSGNDLVTNYNIYYGVASLTYTNTVAAGTNLTMTVTNLIRNTMYYFAATAVDTNGLESDYSIEVSALDRKSTRLNSSHLG